MRLAVDLTKVHEKAPLPVKDYDVRIEQYPFIMDETLILRLEAQVGLQDRDTLQTTLEYVIPRDPVNGWNTPKMVEVIDAFGIPYDQDGIDTEDFVGKTGRAFVEHRVIDGGPPKAYISRLIPQAGR